MNNIASGRAKLGSLIPFEDLPKDWNANLWNEIKEDCNLTIGELDALQNAVCAGQRKDIITSLTH
jgi:hypothetical protein